MTRFSRRTKASFPFRSLLSIGIISGALYSFPLSAAANPHKLILIQPTEADGQPQHTNLYKDTSNSRYQLVEEFTAATLDRHEFKIGSDVEFGMTNRLMIGFDTYSMLVGIPTGQAKLGGFQFGRHSLALGARIVWLNLDNLADFAPAKDQFDFLRAQVIRPAISWTNTISNRLKVHSFWAAGFGKVEARLSEKGKRHFFETKHPGGNYDSKKTEGTDPLEASEVDPDADTEEPQVSSEKNQVKISEESSNVSRRTLELQSLFGLSTDKFQITGEYSRNSHNKILVTTKIERMELEGLRANSLSLTVAQQWISDHLQFRLGLGVQYLSINGRDLDGEDVDETGINPVPEIAFYWRF